MRDDGRYGKALPMFAAVSAAALCALAACLLVCLAACAPNRNAALPDSPFAHREVADLSGYEGMSGSDEPSRLVETTVSEVVCLMDAGESFVLYAGFEDCPFCNRLLPHLNQTAASLGTYVGYIDTRKNPAWQSNTDIDDYAIFADRFGEWLDKDADGSPHLYVPEVFYVKDGQVVAVHSGVTEGADEAYAELTPEQQSTLMGDLANEFACLI